MEETSRTFRSKAHRGGTCKVDVRKSEVKGTTVSVGGKRAEKVRGWGERQEHPVYVETVVLAASTQLFCVNRA